MRVSRRFFDSPLLIFLDLTIPDSQYNLFHMIKSIGMKTSKVILIVAVALMIFAGCSKDDSDVRTPDDILGVWSPRENVYLEFSRNNVIHNLQIMEQDGETIGRWNEEVYFYEPGYKLVIYLTYENKANVYEIVEMTDRELTWCWVDDIKASVIESEGVGKVIGELINKAQEGFKLDPELYETLERVPDDKFYELLESLDLMYPW